VKDLDSWWINMVIEKMHENIISRLGEKLTIEIMIKMLLFTGDQKERKSLGC